LQSYGETYELQHVYKFLHPVPPFLSQPAHAFHENDTAVSPLYPERWWIFRQEKPPPDQFFRAVFIFFFNGIKHKSATTA
jgi:hypothetical protein